MADNTRTLSEEFQKPSATRADLENEKATRLRLGAKSSDIHEFPDKFILITVWPVAIAG